MANSGTVCFLIDFAVAQKRHIPSEFEAFVREHAALKNLDVLYVSDHRRLSGMGSNVYIYIARVDRLINRDILLFFGGQVPDGIKVFIRNSSHDEDWEQIT